MASARELAKQATLLSFVMDNKDKLSTEDVIKNYSDGVTIIAFDIVTNVDGDEYSVYNIAENEKVFINGGSVMNKIFSSLVKEYGSIEKANEELAKEPIKVVLSKAKTKAGNNFTKVTVL